MGVLLSRFRKKLTTSEVLEAVDKDISSLQKFRLHNQQLQKRFIGSLILYSIVLYIVAAVVFYLLYFPDTWKYRIIYSTPLLVFPFLVWLLKKFLHWYFVKRIAKNDDALRDLRDKKKQILEEVMEKETYKKAKEILEKFDPTRFKQIEKPISPISASTPKPGAASIPGSDLRQRSGRGPITPMFSGPQSGPPPRGVSSPAYPMATPHLPRPGGAPRLQGTQMPASGERNGYGAPRGPPLPRPILPRERGTLDKMVEYLVGDGPQNRYALICRYCHSHNGMALKEEFEYLTFRCCYCYSMNPAAKQRPNAPKLEVYSLVQPGKASDDQDSDEDYDDEDDEDEEDNDDAEDKIETSEKPTAANEIAPQTQPDSTSTERNEPENPPSDTADNAQVQAADNPDTDAPADLLTEPAHQKGSETKPDDSGAAKDESMEVS